VKKKGPAVMIRIQIFRRVSPSVCFGDSKIVVGRSDVPALKDFLGRGRNIGGFIIFTLEGDDIVDGIETHHCGEFHFRAKFAPIKFDPAIAWYLLGLDARKNLRFEQFLIGVGVFRRRVSVPNALDHFLRPSLWMCALLARTAGACPSYLLPESPLVSYIVLTGSHKWTENG
jgi:hypothetical protein